MGRTTAPHLDPGRESLGGKVANPSAGSWRRWWAVMGGVAAAIFLRNLGQ